MAVVISVIWSIYPNPHEKGHKMTAAIIPHKDVLMIMTGLTSVTCTPLQIKRRLIERGAECKKCWNKLSIYCNGLLYKHEVGGCVEYIPYTTCMVYIWHWWNISTCYSMLLHISNSKYVIWRYVEVLVLQGCWHHVAVVVFGCFSALSVLLPEERSDVTMVWWVWCDVSCLVPHSGFI